MIERISDNDLVLPAKADSVRRVEKPDAVAAGAFPELEPDGHLDRRLPVRLDLDQGLRHRQVASAGAGANLVALAGDEVQCAAT